MPLPEGFEPIETKGGVQKRQKTDTVIITKSGYISAESYEIDVE